MIGGFGTLLALMLLLQIKHMLGDYFLQTRVMLNGRDQYLHLGRFLHAGVHAAGTFIAFTLIGAPIPFALAAGLADWAIHFHIDWWKGRLTAVQNLTPADPAYWRASGVDQALHQLTYVGLIWAWLIYTRA
ncbi:DUF3307 domain-containing protein [Sulfitobacter sp. D35]|uniref:DUF3307 domain-containing protein n=1 Tax=Sulfitobacter sp. D35 TaxID=3083252 RepID=UPI00296F7344|nr:DUF3307 domain-containing protein [Sulfitobacter sp. D35]MDW4496604.1 DUF3307 domain-containing protein [Sulfitobacter sp. D35]